MFNKARWRLTLWFAAVVAVILVVIGGAVYFTARTSLFRQVNSDLEAHAQREVIQPLANRQLDPGRQSLVDIATAGGYFYAITGADGQVLQRTPNTDVTGLAAPADLSPSAKFIDTRSSDGDHLRIYLQPEPERTALNRLVLILAAGGGAGLMLALAGGFLLAGRALAPIQTAVGKQRQFVADASHELRTPLALIRANAELLERDAVKPVAANITSVHDIIGETDRLSALVGQMLTLASADAGQEPAERVPVELGALAADAVREMRLLSAEKQVSINAHADGPAIVCGNTCVIKPAQDTPLSTFNLARTLSDAGVPRGVINVVSGFGSDVGGPLLEHPDVRAVSLTGSTAVGRIVGTTAAKSFKHCSLELGGKNPMIVLDDANLDLAIEGGLWGGFGTTGQRCTATSRIIVQKGIYGEFVERYVDRAKALRVGNGLDEVVDMGPAINEAQLKTDLSYVEIGKSDWTAANTSMGGSWSQPYLLMSIPKCASLRKKSSGLWSRSSPAKISKMPSISPITSNTDYRPLSTLKM